MISEHPQPDDLRWLTVIGDLVEDIVVWSAADVVVGTDNPARISRTRGGSAANVAALAAPHVPTRFVGRVGDDETGSHLVEELRSLGVDPRVERAGTTGCVVVIVDPSAERTMFPDRGAASMLGPVSPDRLAGTAVLHIPAYGLLTTTAAASIIGAATHVHGLGGAVSVDVSATTVVTSLGKAGFEAALEALRPEYLFANADEAEILGLDGRRPPRGCVFVVKRGPGPATITSDDGAIISVAAVHVPGVRDTTGAGDAFAAGFLSARIGGADLVAACEQAHRLAAGVLSSPGAGGQAVREAHRDGRSTLRR